ncbi:hypothetical protein D9M68_981720 [compost metagenome]
MVISFVIFVVSNCVAVRRASVYRNNFSWNISFSFSTDSVRSEVSLVSINVVFAIVVS